MSDIKIQIVAILFVHFLADFIMQTDGMAINKSKSIKWLTIHVVAYGIGLLLLIPFGMTWLWVIQNMALHFATDFVTSRVNAHLYGKGYRHWFFVGIGFDQFIHAVCLILTTP